MTNISADASIDSKNDLSVPWYKTLSRTQWNTLAASNLGWLFDGFENYALILTAGPALRQLLDPAFHAQVPFYVGVIIGINLLGWGIGGLLGGILADYIGRKRMMVLAIMAYSIMTGLSAFAFSWWSFAALRFMVGIAVGSEWATGSSMIAELWPDRARGKGAGLMQCGLGMGFFLASLVWLFIAPIGPNSWRYMYMVGVLPALLTLWIRRSIPESEVWEKTNDRRVAAQERKRRGEQLSVSDERITRFTLTDLLTDGTTRRYTIAAFLMSLTSTVGFWSISTWVPPYIGSLAASEGIPVAQWTSYVGMCFTAGAIVGYAGFGFLADALGRKPVTLTFFALSFILTPALFFLTKDPRALLVLAFVNAIFVSGQHSWMPIWLPELYPTRMRATALAFVFNGPRFISFMGPMLAGSMIVMFGGFVEAAMTLSCIYVVGFVAAFFLPETRGKPLPA